MSDSLFGRADMIEPWDLVIYHGSIPRLHGLWIAVPCMCKNCRFADEVGIPDERFRLLDPWGQLPGPHDVRRESITRSAACG